MPFHWLPLHRQTQFFWASLALTLGLTVWLGVLGNTLTTAGASILDYEFAWSAQRVETIKTLWAGVLDTARFQIQLDYVYLWAYPLSLALGCGRLAGSPHAPMPALGRAAAWAVLPAGAFDAIENTALLYMLSHPATDVLALLAGLSASVKFALIIAALLYLLIAAPIVLFRLRFAHDKIP